MDYYDVLKALCLWRRGHVYRQLKNLHPTHACDEYRANFEMLEKECGYSEHNIPQLQDVSMFLKRESPSFRVRVLSLSLSLLSLIHI